MRLIATYCYGIIALLAAAQVLPFGVLALALAALVLLDFIVAVDKVPAIREVAGAIAVLQNVVGPWMLYTFFNQHKRYHMYVDSGAYSSFAIPATCLLLIGLRLRLPFGTSDLGPPAYDKSSFRMGLVLVALGLAAGAVVRFGPASLAFFFYLLANLRYVGAIYVYMSGHGLRWAVIGAVVAGIYLTSAKHGMFHELLLWGSLGGCYFFVGKSRSLWTKFAAVLLAIVAVVVIQVVKPVFRERLLESENASLFATTREVVQSERFLSAQSLESVVVRVSQGWIVSAAMASVPRDVPHAHGETIEDAIAAAVLPRFLFPEKKIASSRVNVNRFTRLRVGRTTSMGLGPLGESWVNFGYLGGILLMLVFGLLLNSVFHLMGALSKIDPFFYYSIPIVYLQAVKAETEFLMIFNHLTKSLLVVLLVYHGSRLAGLLRRESTVL